MFLQLKNTSIGYSTPLVEGINAALGLGEVCLIIGNNGVGKTTLLKSILHQIQLLEGQIFLNDNNIELLSVKDAAKLVSVVFSKANIPTNYTVTDLISFGKYIHLPYYFELNKNDIEDVENTISLLGLDQYKKVNLTQLSDGNLQKAFIGRALVQNTPCIILDEPTTHLDEENKIMILQILRKLAKEQQKLIVFSSHDWRLAKEFSDKIWYLKDQKLISGITEEVLLQQKELTQPQLFNFHPNFKAPKIFAPSMEAEMLYSFLQKNFNLDFSNYTFEFDQNSWKLKTDNSQQIFSNFSEISKFIP